MNDHSPPQQDDHVATTAAVRSATQVFAAPATAAAGARRSGAWGRALRSWRLWLIVCALVAVALPFGALQGWLRDRVPYGVSVGGAQPVGLGGLTQREAAARVAELIAARGLTTVVIEGKGGRQVLPLAQFGTSLDAAATAARAASRGRRSILPGLALWLGGRGEVAPVERFDPATFEQGVESLAVAVETPAVDARLTLDSGKVGVRAGRDGLVIDEPLLHRQLDASLERWRQYVAAPPLRPAAPRVGTAEAELARQAAAQYLSAPLVLRYRGRIVRLAPAELATMLSVNTGGDASGYPLTFDNRRARETLHRLFRFAERPAVNARVVLKGKDVFITASREGFGLDTTRLLADMGEAARNAGLRTVIVSLGVVQPTRTTQELQEMGLSGLGSQFSTYYDAKNRPRAHNIIQAAKLVDGTTIGAGETFSLNATLGPRTLNRGFDYAPVIQDGVLRQGVGGGVCQFATTLFNAAFFAGLPIVERHAHEFYIDHYPVGRDAAVSYGSYDLKFRNDSGHNLMLRCWARNGELAVVLIGDTGRSVTYTTSPFFAVRKPGTTRSRPRVIEDDALPRGVVVWEHGWDGLGVRVTRTVSENGRVISRDTFASGYEPKDWVKRIGTR